MIRKVIYIKIKLKFKTLKFVDIIIENLYFFKFFSFKLDLFAGDIYVHADLHGASSVIIKNPSGRHS